MMKLKALLPLIALSFAFAAPSFAEDQATAGKPVAKDTTLVDGKKAVADSKDVQDDKDCSCKKGKCDGKSCSEKQSCKSCKGKGQKDCKLCKGKGCKHCKMHHHHDGDEKSDDAKTDAKKE